MLRGSYWTGYNVGDQRLIRFLQLFTGTLYGQQLSDHHCGELAFTHTISKHHQGLWSIIGFVELLQENLDNILHVLDDLLVLATVLHPDLHNVLGSLVIQ